MSIPIGPWTLHAGRSIETCNGTFYISYGKDRFGNPNYRDFCELDQITKVVAKLPELIAAVQEAERTFRHYAEIHAAKGPEGADKAMRNTALADRMADALKEHRV